MDDKRARLCTILKELRRQRCREEKVGFRQQKQRGGGGIRSVIRYHSPYVDSSGERFFLPHKWQQLRDGGSDDDKNWKECNVNYSFDKDDMNGTHLIQNLKWLGKSNELIDLFGGGSNESSSPWWWQRICSSSSQEMCEVDDDEDSCNEEYDEDEEEGRLMGRGAVVVSSGRRMMMMRQRSNDATFGEKELR